MAPKLWSGAKAKPKATKKKPALAKESVAIKGLAGFKKASAIFSGAVDKGVFQQHSALASRATVLAGWDARLVAINPLTKSDRYYVIQGLEDPKVPSGKAKRCYAYRRWGHTGTGGVCRIEGPMEQHKVEEQLMSVFKAKTGVAWGVLKPGEKVQPGSYWLAAPSEGNPNAVWQYLVEDGVDKKTKGWYPYDGDAIEQLEELHAEHAANTSSKNPTAKRFVKSGSFTYCVDLAAHTQQNTTSMKRRQIRRLTSGASTRTGTPTSTRSTKAPSHSSDATLDGLARADTGPSLHRSDTATTLPSPWNGAEWNDVATSLARPIKRSSTSFSEFPGIPNKRRRENSEATISLNDMRKIIASGDDKKLSVPTLRSWVRSMGMVASGSKEDLWERARALVSR